MSRGGDRSRHASRPDTNLFTRREESPLPVQHAETPDPEDERLFRAVSREPRRGRRLYSQVKIPVLRDYGREDFPRAHVRRPHSHGGGRVRRELRSRRFSARAFVDETGLNEPEVRAGFLTRIFALAGFREVKKSGRTARLVCYQAENKLLFLTYHQETMREMGRIAANHENHAFGEVVSAYESALLRLLAHPPARASYVNALTHAMGHFSEKKQQGRKESLSRYGDTIPGGKNSAERPARNA